MKPAKFKYWFGLKFIIIKRESDNKKWKTKAKFSGPQRYFLSNSRKTKCWKISGKTRKKKSGVKLPSRSTLNQTGLGLPSNAERDISALPDFLDCSKNQSSGLKRSRNLFLICTWNMGPNGHYLLNLSN